MTRTPGARTPGVAKQHSTATTVPRNRATIDSAAPKRRKAAPVPPIAPFAHDTLAFHLDEPPSANRWWRMWRGRMVLSEEARTYKQYVANAALVKRYRAIPKGTPVRVLIMWQRGRKSGDLDKRIGIALDSLQGVAYENDSQIVEIHATRIDVKHAHAVIVHVTPITPEDDRAA